MPSYRISRPRTAQGVRRHISDERRRLSCQTRAVDDVERAVRRARRHITTAEVVELLLTLSVEAQGGTL